MVLKLFLILGLAGLAVCLFFAYLSITAKAPESGLEDGRLRPCPDAPNCVSSEQGTDKSRQVSALAFRDAPDQAWQRLKNALVAMGGQIIEEQPGYLHAIFTSRVFRFIDDMEFRLSPDEGVIGLRSASRAGHSDFGVNRKRVEELRHLYQKGSDSRQ